jgi:hypothetical protein
VTAADLFTGKLVSIKESCGGLVTLSSLEMAARYIE